MTGAPCPKSPKSGGDFAQSEGFKFNEDAKSCWGTQGLSCTRRHPAPVLATILGLINANEGARRVLAPRSPGGLQRGAGALPGRRRQRPARCFLFRCGWDFPALAVGPRSAPAAALFSISKAAEADACNATAISSAPRGRRPRGTQGLAEGTHGEVAVAMGAPGSRAPTLPRGDVPVPGGRSHGCFMSLG